MNSDASSSPRLMVIDDERDLADALCQWIRLSSTWIAHAAYDLPDALTQARACPPDVILLDLEMPGAEGFEIAGFPDTAGGGCSAVVALTGDPALREQALHDRRFSGALLKPADLRRFHRLLSRLAPAT